MRPYSKEQYKLWREKIIELSDGRYSDEIASVVGCTREYVRKVWSSPDGKNLKRPPSCSPKGTRNPSWTGGRLIQRCGRVLVPAPEGHPNARVYSNKKIGRILEHRLAMERHLGRFLNPDEVVDHIDECVLHNDILNLRLFSKNSEHLKATISGRKKDLSSLGKKNIFLARKGLRRQPYDRHHEMWRLGDYRLLQILHAHLLLDKDSPYLLGTHRYLVERQIDFESSRKLKQSLISLCKKWELDQKLSRLKHLL